MKTRLIHLFLTVALLLCAAAVAPGQGKIYTRKARLADFPTRTTKVVVGGHSILELALREEIPVHWRISPYEFCDQQEYERLSSSPSYYFLTLGHDGGLAFLVLSKGGHDAVANNAERPFEVVRLPIASYDEPSGRELVFMGAFLDILQQYVEQAMISERTAYSGPGAANGVRLSGKTVYLDPDTADRMYLQGESDALCGICVAPAEPGPDAFCYKMLIAADTHELFYYAKAKYKNPGDAAFTPAEVKAFERRRAIIK